MRPGEVALYYLLFMYTLRLWDEHQANLVLVSSTSDRAGDHLHNNASHFWAMNKVQLQVIYYENFWRCSLRPACSYKLTHWIELFLMLRESRSCIIGALANVIILGLHPDHSPPAEPFPTINLFIHTHELQSPIGGSQCRDGLAIMSLPKDVRRHVRS